MADRVLLLLFYLGKKPYAIRARGVIEVLPLPEFEPVPKAPDYVAGLFVLRGEPVPVIDLCRLVHGIPCASRMSSRVILVPCAGEGDESRVLGLLAERVTDTAHKDAGELIPTGLEVDGAPWLGPVYRDASGLVRCIEIERILPESLKRNLFQNARSVARRC